MAISIDWPTAVIFIPKADTILIQSTPNEVRQLDISAFRLVLKDLEDDDVGMSWPDTHSHNTTIEVGGAILARVVQILEPYTITFEDGQYAVNLVGANSNIADRLNVNQVSVRSLNSAGLQDLSSLQAASFTDGGITVDILSIYDGVIFPVGTNGKPVNNIPDAVSIATNRGIDRINIIGSYTFDLGDNIDNLRIFGQNMTLSLLVLLPDASTLKCEFSDANITGVLDGGSTIERCLVYTLTYLSGFVYRSILSTGTISLGGGSPAVFIDCFCGVLPPTIDMGGSGQSLFMRRYVGSIAVMNKTGPGDIAEINLDPGIVYIDLTTCTEGSIMVQGKGKVLDMNSGDEILSGTYGNLTVMNYTVEEAAVSVADKQEIANNVWNADSTQYTTDGSMGHYLLNKVLSIVKFLGLK